MAKDSKTDTKQIDKPWLFQPGESGNPNGRPPKEFSMTNTLREILSCEDKETRLKNYEQIMVTAVEKAKAGDNDMIKYLINRLDGMPVGTAPTLNVENLEQLVIVRDYHADK